MKEDPAEILWSYIQEHIDKAQYQELQKRVEAGKHPEKSLLLAYSRDTLDIHLERVIDRHLAVCRRCTQVVLQAMRQVDLTDALVHEYYWEPTAHERQHTAATGKHVFTLSEHQHLTLECEYTEKRIWLEWHIDAAPDDEYILLFIDPETREQLYRKSLNTICDGELTISRAQLGFDPTATRWAIAIGTV